MSSLNIRKEHKCQELTRTLIMKENIVPSIIIFTVDICIGSQTYS